jgi:hypothetical protein
MRFLVARKVDYHRGVARFGKERKWKNRKAGLSPGLSDTFYTENQILPAVSRTTVNTPTD